MRMSASVVSQSLSWGDPALLLTGSSITRVVRREAFYAASASSNITGFCRLVPKDPRHDRRRHASVLDARANGNR